MTWVEGPVLEMTSPESMAAIGDTVVGVGRPGEPGQGLVVGDLRPPHTADGGGPRSGFTTGAVSRGA